MPLGQIQLRAALRMDHAARPDRSQLGRPFPGLTAHHAEACGHGGRARHGGGGPGRSLEWDDNGDGFGGGWVCGTGQLQWTATSAEATTRTARTW
jgi:hypothetical protein